jgi:hypothetical protein
LRRICGELEVNNPSAVEAEHNQGIEDPERRSGDYKLVDRRNIGQVVAQKGPPGRGGDLRTPRHSAPNCGLADRDAELEQLAVDAGRPPQRVGFAHAADQITDVCADLGPARTARSPPPKEPEALAVPLDHGGRLDQYHRVDHLGQIGRATPIEVGLGMKAEADRDAVAEDGQLMSQSNKLKLQRGAATDTEFEDRKKGAKNRHHDRDGTARSGESPVILGLVEI